LGALGYTVVVWIVAAMLAYASRGSFGGPFALIRSCVMASRSR
jgi:hypothetical protein